MVIGHVFKAAGKVVNKTVPKGSRIQVDKAVKMAQGISPPNPNHRYSDKEIEVVKDLVRQRDSGQFMPNQRLSDHMKRVTRFSDALDEVRKERKIAFNKKFQKKGTGPRGGNTRNDKVIDKKLKKKKANISKVIKSDKKRILVGKLPVVKRKGHYKKQSKNTSLVANGSDVKATELKRSKHKKKFNPVHEAYATSLEIKYNKLIDEKADNAKVMKWAKEGEMEEIKAEMTFRLEEIAEDTGLVSRSRVENKFFRGNKKGSSPFEIWQNKKESAPKGSHHQTGNRGTTFWKKTADGRSTFRNPMERGEQTIKKENAKKWTGVGVGLGGAATLGGLGSEPSRAEVNAQRYLKKSKDERWGYW